MFSERFCTCKFNLNNCFICALSHIIIRKNCSAYRHLEMLRTAILHFYIFGFFNFWLINRGVLPINSSNAFGHKCLTLSWRCERSLHFSPIFNFCWFLSLYIWRTDYELTNYAILSSNLLLNPCADDGSKKEPKHPLFKYVRVTLICFLKINLCANFIFNCQFLFVIDCDPRSLIL